VRAALADQPNELLVAELGLECIAEGITVQADAQASVVERTGAGTARVGSADSADSVGAGSRCLAVLR
jgi:hypothetical protein